jgi:hypothetical protein
LIELIHKRKWDSKTFNTGRTKIDPVTKKVLPILATKLQNGLHDIEPDGSFVPCDIRVSEVTQGVTHLKMNRGRMGELRFGDSSHPNSFLVKIKNKGLKGVSFKYTGADGESMTANNGKPLCHFDNGISIESTPYYKGVKMDIIVNDPTTAPLEYPFSVKDYGQKYTFIENADGGATLRGEDQDPIFVKPPYAVDANGDIGPVTIHYTGMDGNLITFKKVVDEAWLRQAAAPVRIDPDVTIEDGVDGGVIEDSYIWDTVATTNYGSTTPIVLYNNGSQEKILFYKVDLSGIGPIAVIDAYMGLDMASGFSFPLVAESHEVIPLWVESQITWNLSSAGNSWNTAGAKGDGIDRVAAVDAEETFTEIVSDFHFKVSNTLAESSLGGWLSLMIEHKVVGGQAEIHSSETVTGNKPYFYVEFTEEAAAGLNGMFGMGRMGIR